MRFDVDLPADLLRQLDGLSNIDEIAPEMLAAAAPYAVDSIKKAVRRRSFRSAKESKKAPGWAGGALEKSVKAGKAKLKNGKYSMNISFTGYDKSQASTAAYPDGVPNAVKAAGIEYGNAHQAAQPFLQSAANACAEDVANAMQEKYNQKVAKT